MFRAFLASLLIVLNTVLFGVVALLGCPFDRTGRLFHWLARGWARVLLRGMGVRVEITGRENIPPGPAVYAVNHGSALDIPILFGFLPVGFRIVHKRSLYLIPVIGWSLYLGGHVAIDRGRAFGARRSLREAAARLRAGTSILAFPEGTRSPDARVQPFKRGSFVLAVQAQVPVVPISLAGVKQVAPDGLTSLRPGTVRLAIHPAVPTAGLGREATKALAANVRQLVVAGCPEAA